MRLGLSLSTHRRRLTRQRPFVCLSCNATTRSHLPLASTDRSFIPSTPFAVPGHTTTPIPTPLNCCPAATARVRPAVSLPSRIAYHRTSKHATEINHRRNSISASRIYVLTSSCGSHTGAILSLLAGLLPGAKTLSLKPPSTRPITPTFSTPCLTTRAEATSNLLPIATKTHMRNTRKARMEDTQTSKRLCRRHLHFSSSSNTRVSQHTASSNMVAQYSSHRADTRTTA